MPTGSPAPGRPPGEPVRDGWAKAALETSTRLAARLRTTAETITCPFTSDLPRGSLRGKHFLEQGRRPRRRIRPDLPLLLAHHVEETVQRLAHHVVVKVEGLALRKGNGLEAPHQLLVLADHADFSHGAINDGLEGRRELVRRRALEEVRGRGVSAAQDLLGVVEGHGADGVPEDLLGGGRGFFRRPIHAQHELVDLGPVAHHPQPLLHRLELLGHEDLDRFVAEVAVRPPREAHGLLGGDLERFLQSGSDLDVGQAAALLVDAQTFEDLIELRPGGRGEECEATATASLSAIMEASRRAISCGTRDRYGRAAGAARATPALPGSLPVWRP